MRVLFPLKPTRMARPGVEILTLRGSEATFCSTRAGFGAAIGALGTTGAGTGCTTLGAGTTGAAFVVVIFTGGSGGGGGVTAGVCFAIFTGFGIGFGSGFGAGLVIALGTIGAAGLTIGTAFCGGGVTRSTFGAGAVVTRAIGSAGLRGMLNPDPVGRFSVSFGIAVREDLCPADFIEPGMRRVMLSFMPFMPGIFSTRP